MAYNINEITDLGGRAFIPGQGFGLGAVAVGQPVGARFSITSASIASDDMLLTVTNPDTGDPMEIQVKGGDELLINQFGELTNIVDPNDNVFYGNPNPKWTGGLTNSFSWNNFDLSVLFTFAAGHDLNNDEQNFQYRAFGYGWNMWANGVDRWQQPGDVTHMQRLVWSPNRFQSSRFNHDADYVRLKDVTIGYNFPKNILQRWKVGNVQLSVSDAYWDLISQEANDKRVSDLHMDLGAGAASHKYDDRNMNLPYIRLPEMYLIRAEARAENGNHDGGLADLNRLRQRAGINATTYSDKVDLLGKIYVDRSLELSMEGDNFHNFKRLERPIGGYPWEEAKFKLFFFLPEKKVQLNPNLVQNDIW